MNVMPELSAPDALAPVFANGIALETGAYAEPPVSPRELAASLLAQGLDRRREGELRDHVEALEGGQLGLLDGYDEKELASAGWAIVWPSEAEPAVEAALAPLVAYRREQASRLRAERFREIRLAPGEQAWQLLARFHCSGATDADPDKLPYYLLLVGSPRQIPFELQQALDVSRAVGRLCLETPEHHAAYAEALVEREKAADHGPRQEPRQALFLAAGNADDPASRQSHDFLVRPLAGDLATGKIALPAGWRLETALDGGATKDRLAAALAPESGLGLLFSASHGLQTASGHARQHERQGALVTQDWPGPKAAAGRPPREGEIFAAVDLPSSARLDGLVAFHFGCFGAGTRRRASYRPDARPEQAPADFAALLPQRLLARGAGAVVAQLDRSWGYGFLGLEGGLRLEPYQGFLRRLLGGHPIGSALEPFGRRHPAMEYELACERRAIVETGKRLEDAERFARLWTATEDARGTLLLGDPAARLGGGPP